MKTRKFVLRPEINCNCEPQHTPTPWIKSVMHEATRTPEEVAFFAGPNAGYVLRAVNSHEEMIEALKLAYDELKREAKTTGAHFMNELTTKIDAVIAKAEGKD